MSSKWWAIILAGILALSLGLGIWVMQPGRQADRAEIWSEGELKYTLELSQDTEVTVQTARGSNTVTVKDGKIAVTAADCPDHYCMKRGYRNGGTQIVCLPNRLVIKFVGSQSVDGAAG